MKRYGEVRGRGGVKKRHREKGVSQKDVWQGRRKEQEGEMEQRGRREKEGMERWRDGSHEGGRGREEVAKREGWKKKKRSGKEGWVIELEGEGGGKRQGRGERKSRSKNVMSRRHVYQIIQESMAEMEGCVSAWKEEEGRCQGER